MPHPKIKELYDLKCFGQKSSKGFYDYKDSEYTRVDFSEEKAAKYNPISLLGVASNNAAWLITNQVCSKEDLGIALKLGMGLKTDLFKLIEKFGIQIILDNFKKLEEKYGEFYRPDVYLLSLK